MKVRLVIREFWPLKGGLTLHALRLAQEMIKRNHDFQVITPFTERRPGGNNRFWATEKERVFTNEGVPTQVYGLNLLQRLWLLPLKKLKWRPRTQAMARSIMNSVLVPKFRRYFSGVDLIHYDGSGVEFIGFAAYEAARLYKIPFIIQPSIHIGQWGHLPIDHQFFKLGDGLLAHSKIERDYLVNQVGISTRKVHLVYNGIDDILPADPQSFRSRYRLKGPIILFLGRKSHDKGYPLLRRAFKTVRKARPDVHLVCVGPEGKTELTGISQEGVLELNYLSETEKSEALLACDLLCVPSEGESFGLVFLEAGRARKPFVARDLELFEDLLGPNGHAGYRIGKRLPDGTVELSEEELANQLIKIVDTPEMSTRMGAQGYENSARFLWPAIGKRFEDAYEKIIADSQSG